MSAKKLLCTPSRLLATPARPWPRHFQTFSRNAQSQTHVESTSDSHSFGILQSKPTGKKFIDLTRGMDQRAAHLAKIESIDPLPTQSAPTSAVTKKVVLESKLYEEDPEFKFERKRGKRHVMNRLKNNQAMGVGQQSDSSQLEANRPLVQALDISKRKPNVTRITFTVPKKGSSETASDTPTGMEEFINFYLGSLVWSNPEVDLSVSYSTQTKSSSMKIESTDSEPREVQLDGVTRTQILDMILK